MSLSVHVFAIHTFAQSCVTEDVQRIALTVVLLALTMLASTSVLFVVRLLQFAFFFLL